MPKKKRASQYPKSDPRCVPIRPSKKQLAEAAPAPQSSSPEPEPEPQPEE
jgi:hypothetical protein